MAYGKHQSAAEGIIARCAVLTLTDTRTESTDTSGQLIRDLLTSEGHNVADYRLIPDEPAVLEPLLLDLLGRDTLDAILANGGTGISRRDQTVTVIAKHLDQPLPGFGELFRMLSWQEIGTAAMLSRAIGGIARGKVVFALPGSNNAVELAMKRLILPEIKHLLFELRK